MIPFEFLEVIPMAAMVVDSTGIIARSNAQLENLFGYTREELQGSPLGLLIPERYHTQHDNEFERYIKTPGVRTVGRDQHIYGRHKNGLEIPVEVKFGPQTTQQGGTSVVALITDVTEHCWIEKHLKEKKDRLSILLELTKAIPWAADPVTWNFTFVGTQAVDILGYSVAQWYEKDFWVQKIHPDDRERTIQLCADYSKAHSDYEIEYRMIKANGDVSWFQDIVNVEYKNKEPFILRGFLIDITARKQADLILQEEKQFSDSIIGSLPGLFFMIDREFRYVRWNKNYEKLAGVSSDELAGRKISELVSPETRDEVMQGIETGFREGSVSAEYENLDKDGKKIYYAGYGVRTHIGGHDYLVGIEIDISKQKELEQHANQLRNELAHVNRVASMGELTASIAHELNQPLTAIMSNAQAAQHFLEGESPNIEEVSAALSDIVSANRRAGEVIKHLRIMLVKGEPEKVRLDINDVINEVIKLVNNDALIRGIGIFFEKKYTKYPVSQSTSILGDRIQLQQVVLNIILNAFDAMAETDKEARKLVIRVSQNNDDRLIVEFIDNGQGFTEQGIDKLFNAFYTSKQKGMGMGLAISRSIIEAHEGEIGAIQNKEGGATVHFSLPIVTGGSG